MNIYFRCLESRIDKNNTLYGKFNLTSIPSGQGNTFANALRRSLFSDLSGLAITHFCITSSPGLGYEFATLPGLAESLLDFSLNLKKVVLTGRLTGALSTCYKSPSLGTSTPSLPVPYPIALHQRCVPLFAFGDGTESKGFHDRGYGHRGKEVAFNDAKAFTSYHPSAKEYLQEPKVKKGESQSFRTPFFTPSPKEYVPVPHGLRSPLMAYKGNWVNKGVLRRRSPVRTPCIEDAPPCVPSVSEGFHPVACTPKGGKGDPLKYFFGVKNEGGKQRGTNLPKKENKKYNVQNFPPLAPIGFLKAKGPAILRACDLILPPGIRCVHPDQYIGTLAADSALSIKFLIAAGKGYIVQDETFYKSLSRAKLLLSSRNSKNPIFSTSLPVAKRIPIPSVPSCIVTRRSGGAKKEGKALHRKCVPSVPLPSPLVTECIVTRRPGGAKNEGEDFHSKGDRGYGHRGKDAYPCLILSPCLLPSLLPSVAYPPGRRVKKVFAFGDHVRVSPVPYFNLREPKGTYGHRSKEDAYLWFPKVKAFTQRVTTNTPSPSVTPSFTFSGRIPSPCVPSVPEGFHPVACTKGDALFTFNDHLWFPKVKNEGSKPKGEVQRELLKVKGKEKGKERDKVRVILPKRVSKDSSLLSRCTGMQNKNNFVTSHRIASPSPLVVLASLSRGAKECFRVPKVKNEGIRLRRQGVSKGTLFIKSIDQEQSSSQLSDNEKLSRKQLIWGIEDKLHPVLPLDATFTPISKVNFQVDIDRNTEKSEETIILEIWTNGSITPKRAIQESCLALAQDFYSLFSSVNGFSNLHLWWKRESLRFYPTRLS